jgi:hypothetical protein
MVSNISYPHFFEGRPHLKEQFETIWKELNETGIIHLRVMISWSGFTSQTHQLVQQFNRKHPKQPIALVYPTQVDNKIYGPLAEAL